VLNPVLFVVNWEAMNYFIIGGIFGMITVYHMETTKGPGAFGPAYLGTTGELIVGAFIGSVWLHSLNSGSKINDLFLCNPPHNPCQQGLLSYQDPIKAAGIRAAHERGIVFF
jgi:uncharacterized membrane protein YeaQ/YmgE (transglycosylase-associated protein family)